MATISVPTAEELIATAGVPSPTVQDRAREAALAVLGDVPTGLTASRVVAALELFGIAVEDSRVCLRELIGSGRIDLRDGRVLLA